MKKGGLAGLVIFGLFWTAFVGTFDVFIGRQLYRQACTSGYVETTGTVTHSEVTQHRGNKGSTTYGVNIHYTYRVDGAAYSGTRYRHNDFKTSDSKGAYAAVEQRPVGKEVPVFYDAGNPSDAVLATGIDGGDLFLVLFLSPFNAVMLGLWAGVFNLLPWRASGAGGVRTWNDGRYVRARLPKHSPFFAGLVLLGLASFISIFVVGLTTGFRPSLHIMVLVWTGLLGSVGALVFWQWRQDRRGRSDLVVDSLEQTITLPATFGRRRREPLPLTALQGVEVEEIVHHGRKGGTSYSYAVHLKVQGGRQKLVEWWSRPRAEALAAWLRERLPQSEPAAPPRKHRPAGATEEQAAPQ